jgi:uncharacterized protein
MSAYRIHEAANGQFHFNLVADNGERVLHSETYTTKNAAQDGVAACRKQAADPAAYEKKTDAKGQAYFLLKGRNGEVIGKSESYSSPAARDDGIALVRRNGPVAQAIDADA